MENKPICEIDKDGNKKWYLDGRYHREDGPAVIWKNGNKYWYINDKLHREDGPAIEYIAGAKTWYFNGKIHRLDGPALIWSDGSSYWSINDYDVTSKIIKWAKDNDIDLDNLTDVDKTLIKLVWADYTE